MRIGILALQGAFAEHAAMLRKLDAEPVELRQLSDLQQSLDGIILPGGESTVMGKLLRDLEMFPPIRNLILSGLPVFGTCAGMILLAERVEDGTPHLGTMHVTAKRNAYGRQLGSFHTVAPVTGVGEIPMTFIRAPYLTEVGKDVSVLAEVDGCIVAAQQAHQLAVAFHPELTQDLRMHEYFLKIVRNTSISQ
jgi:5'-phosphate synthase pdxT subunit